MARRRFLYLVVLLSSTIFYWANQQWLGWMLLLTVLCLPVFSLVLSLPGMFSLKLRLKCPSFIQRGTKVYAQVTNEAWLPAPSYDCIISVYKPLTNTLYRLKDAQEFPTEHCGQLECRIEKVRVSDYLGLFRFRLGSDASSVITVRPKQAMITQLPRLQRHLALSWKPKPGGGFAENHEVRLYRPGDNLNQIHWKLSAKTGKLVIREPMIPIGQEVVVGLCLYGSEKELDMKFDRLTGACSYLLETGVSFELHAITADGIAILPISTEQELADAVDKLLGMESAAEEQELPDHTPHTYWIGGQDNGK